jgi:hypothetical protein
MMRSLMKKRTMMKTKGKIDFNFLIILFLLIVAIVILLYILIFKINSEGVQCTSDPLVFGVRKLQEANIYPIQCSCSLLSDYPSQTLHIDSTGQRYENHIIESRDIPEINWGELIVSGNGTKN